MSHFCRVTAYCAISHRHLLAYYRSPRGQQHQAAQQALHHRYPGSQPIQTHITILETHRD